MRSRGSNEAITATLIAGTEVVLIGLDVAPAYRAGLLGFSIWRRTARGGEFEPLLGGRSFRGLQSADKGGAPLSDAPVQDFLWGDYVVDPDTDYVYRIACAYGRPGALDHRHGLEIAVRTESADDGRHGIYFNRGVAASQGYTRRFGEHARWYRGELYGRKVWNRFVRPENVPDRAAHAWLSRGLGEAMEAFIRSARHDPAVDGPSPRRGLRAAVYEFTDPKTVRAFVDVLESGADVRIVHHAARKNSRGLHRSSGAITTVEYDDPERDPIAFRNSEVRQESRPDAICAAALDAVDAVGIRLQESQRAFEAMLIPRENTSIQHNKFIILLEDDRPVAVWTGSTNLTEGGIYGQSNVGQVVRDPEIARQFLDYWSKLAEDPPLREEGGRNGGGFAEWVGFQYPDPVALPAPGSTTALFSPRPTQRLLDWYAELFGNARQSVHFTTAFTVADAILAQALERPADGALRYLLMESVGGRLREPYERMRSLPANRIAWGDRLGTVSESPGEGAGPRLAETLTGLNEHVSYMHTKYMLVDALGDDPIVISGSANFSRASTVSNDENMIVYRGDRRVGDIFLSEFMRLFRHFESRNRRNLLPREQLAAHDHLVEDDSWSAEAFTEGKPSFLERRLFAEASVS